MADAIAAHAAEQVIVQKLNDAKQTVEVGGIYAHYRNPTQHYKVIAVALLEANEAPCVVYQPLYGSEAMRKMIWVRALDSWSSEVALEGKTVPRFHKVQTK